MAPAIHSKSWQGFTQSFSSSWNSPHDTVTLEKCFATNYMIHQPKSLTEIRCCKRCWWLYYKTSAELMVLRNCDIMFFFSRVIQQRKEVMESLMFKGACGALCNRSAAAVEYLPALRTICRSEQLKEKGRVKRRCAVSLCCSHHHLVSPMRRKWSLKCLGIDTPYFALKPTAYVCWAPNSRDAPQLYSSRT